MDNPETTTTTPPAQPAPAAPPQQPPPAPAINTITVEQHNRELEKVRSDEKQKQFDRIADLERQLAEASTKNQELQVSLNAITANTKDGGVDVKKVIEEVTTAAANIHGQQIKQTEKQLEQLRSEVAQERLSRFRMKAIEDAGGPNNLVVGLVRGNTEEEIRASVAEAQAEYEKIRTRIAPPANPAPPANTETVTTTPPPPVNPAQSADQRRGTGADSLEGKSIKEMTPKEYAEKRETIQRDLRNRFNKPLVRR